MTHSSGTLRFLALVAAAVAATSAFADLPELTKKRYEERAEKDGVVLVSVNWGRLWKVRGFENAELRGLFFDLAGKVKGPAERADLEINGPAGLLARLATTPRFVDYAFPVPAGRYLMSGFDVKLAASVSAIYHLKPDRTMTMAEGRSKLGFFEVKPGEIVYIGNFWLDRAQAPFIWRYYSPRPKPFEAHSAEFKGKYPFLPTEAVVYRLFETSTMGVSDPASAAERRATDQAALASPSAGGDPLRPSPGGSPLR